MAPLVKVGGLGDVLGALPHALVRRGHDVTVILPGFRSALEKVETVDRGMLDVRTGSGESIPTQLLECQVSSSRADGQTVRVLLVDQPWYFDRGAVYVDPNTGEASADDHERWFAFCASIAPACEKLDWVPDVIHANDSHVGPYCAAHVLRPRPSLRRTGLLFSIHNLAFQGWYEADAMRFGGWDPNWHQDVNDPLEYRGGTNFMKMGIALSDLISTVSERYAFEICTDSALGCGLEGLLGARRGDVRGVLNGIDVDTWNPATDPHLTANYDVDDLSGKEACRKALLEEAGLEPVSKRTLVFGWVSRLTLQKGVDLLLGAADHILNDDIRLVVLGSGVREYEVGLRALAARYPKRVRVFTGFDEALAHRIEAGSDVFLMPSRYEPCGLNQMYSMRYGTVPVVRWTGGLVDTVDSFDPWTRAGCGFHFTDLSADGLLDAVGRAAEACRHPESRSALIRNGMTQDFSWDRSATCYEALYREILARHR